MGLSRSCLIALGAGWLATCYAALPGALTPLASPPAPQARSWVLIDYASGQVLAEGNADLSIEPASLTKLMSAYVVFNALCVG